jgi:hypothetical protein
MNGRTMRWAAGAAVLVGLGFGAGAWTALGADEKKSLAMLLPAAYTTTAKPTELEWDLVRVMPSIQIVVGESGVTYMGYDVDERNERIRFRFAAMRAAWTRKSLEGFVGSYLAGRYPDIPTKVWAVWVFDFAAKRRYVLEDGKWQIEAMEKPAN